MAKVIDIKNAEAPELELYTRLNENQLYHYFEPEIGLFMAESPMIIARAIQAGYTPMSVLADRKMYPDKLGEILKLLDHYEEIPVYTADFDTLTAATGFRFSLTRGAMSVMYRKEQKRIEEVCADTHRIAILENVVNPTNVGAIFRSAAALNMDAVLLTEGCADPLYRRAIRVSMATVFQIPWAVMPAGSWPQEVMDTLHKMGFSSVAMALKEDSVNIDDPALNAEERLAIVLGTEGDGLAARTIADCDYTCMIPMAHGVDSLNVAAASAVAFWQLGRNNGHSYTTCS